MKLLRFVCLFVAVWIGNSVMAQSQRELQQLMRDRGEYYFTLNVKDLVGIENLGEICSVDGTDGHIVIAYANQEEYDKLIALGLQPNLQTPPSLRSNVTMWDGQGTYNWNAYLTYPQYVSMMEGFPALATATGGRTCTLIDLGQLSTSAHRHLLGVRINNGNPNGKPKFLYTSTMHGDEVTGMILMLRLIDELCTSTDSRILNLLNDVDIYIFPCTNPDGTYAAGNNTVNGATRANGNSIDLNRNYKDYFNGDHPDGANSYQNETTWTMALADENLFTMGANYHGGAEVMNYCWDWVFESHADVDWWEYVCSEYVQIARQIYSSYMSDTYSDGVTNGATWYTITGSRQDYMNAFGQCREVTVECSTDKTPSASQLPNFWNYNHNSMLALMEQARNGVHGVVYDANTGQTIQGVTVSVLNHDIHNSYVTTHSVGDFHRPIKGGTYTFVFDKEGYERKFVEVTVADDQRVDLTVNLIPSNATQTECFTQFVPNAAGAYLMGYLNGSTLVMPTHNNTNTTNSVSVSATSYSVTPTNDGFTLARDAEPLRINLSASGNAGQYLIAYKGRLLYRNGSSLNWYKPSHTNSYTTMDLSPYRWYVNEQGIYYQSGSTKYYLNYSNGSFTTSNSNQDNVHFYLEGSCLPMEYTVTASAYLEEGGTVEGAGTFLQGETCTLTATANEGYQFFRWTENGETVSTNAVYSFEVTSDKALVALFGPTTPMNITVSASPASAGLVSGGGEFFFGEACTVTATPNTDFAFSGWTENGTMVSDEAEYSFMVTGDRVLVANFDFVPPTPMDCYYSVSTIAPGAYVMGHLNGNTMNILSQNSSTATVTSTDYGFSVENGTTIPQITLTASGSKYYIVYNNRYLTVSSSWNASLTWSSSQPSNGGWNIDRNGIYMSVSSSWSGSTTYYLYYNNGSFQLSTNQNNNITFYQEGDCPTTFSLAAGWNWWTPTVSMSLGDLETLLDGHALLINSQDEGFVQYNGQNWSGTLDTLVPGKMYRILIQPNSETEFSVSGEAVASTITLLPGYNWFGYTGSQSKTLVSAFSGFSPTDGDTITAENGDSATYDSETEKWDGSLVILVPGHGYVYHSNATQGRNITFE